MAKFRQVHVEFWQDGFVLDLTPEEKYFYLYLMTNSKTTQCGIYELPKRIIETETGYNRETVEKLLKRFVDYGKVLYNDKEKEVMLVNWMRHNMIKSPKVLACIKKELQNVKTKEFVNNYIVLCKQYGYGIDTLCIDLGEEEEKEQEKEYKNTHSAYTFYEQNIAIMTDFISQDMNHWIDDFDGNEGVIIEAMKIAVEQNKRNWGYAKAILKDWHDKKARTLADVQALQQEFRNKRNQPSEPQKHYEEIAEDKFLF